MSSSLNVAFVYLGGQLPRYAKKNLSLLVKRFPDLNIVLISDCIKNDDFEGITFFEYDASNITKEFSSYSSLNSKFRDGFWIHTMTRFSALNAFMATKPESPLLHFELDVWIAENFPFDLFGKLSAEISFSLPSSSEGSAAVLFLRDYKSSVKLNEIFKNTLMRRPESTDMSILREIYDSQMMEIDVLPISPSESSDQRSSFAGYLFDPSTWGMYFFGQDSRNARGVQIYHRQEKHHIVCPSAYEIESDGHTIQVFSDSGSLFLVNLHIHSKDLRVFKNVRYSPQHIQKYLMKGGVEEFSEFRFTIFISMLLKKVQRDFMLIVRMLSHE